MSKCIEKIMHTCGHKSLQVFQKEDGTYDGFCFACGQYISNPYADKPDNYVPTPTGMSDEDKAEAFREVFTYGHHDLSHSRGIRSDVLQKYGVRVGLSEYDGSTPAMVFFPYSKDGEVKAFKVRTMQEKRIWSMGSMKEVDLFGWEVAKYSGAKNLYITEGEYDALALYQILVDSVKGTRWEHLMPAVVSLPNGVGNVEQVLSRVAHELKARFENIVYVPDMDEPGLQGAEKVSRIFPAALIAQLPCKDVNEGLLTGQAVAVLNATKWQATKAKNTKLLLGDTLEEEAKKPAVFGRPWPWDGLTRATRGRRTGETYYFGAGVKLGKSELVDSIAAFIMVNDGLPVLMVKPEQAPHQTYKRLVGKVAGKIFHDPNLPFDEDAFDKGSALIKDKAIILDSYQFVDWDTLKDDIRHSVLEYGVQDVFLDPITCFTNTMSASEANEHLVKMSSELSAMALELQFTAYIFCHLKAPSNGPTHERGGHVLSTQFTGSRAMMRSCNYMIGMEGNKDPELEEDERNVRHLVILEDREFGSSSKISLFWDKNTGMFSEIFE